jgi:uncharacterized repeat protein (TIGR02543 family)
MLVVPLQDTQGTTGVQRGASTCETEEEVVNRPRSSAASAAYRPGPITVANNLGAVTFTQTSRPDSLTISGDQIASTVALALGTYKVSGTDLDANGATGTWTFSLTVTNNIVQTSPTIASTTPAPSATYAPGSILVTNNSGAVTFTTTVTNSALSVSTSGAVTTTGTLAVSVYTVSGTDRDTNGDTGTWTFTLTVANVTADLTFNANAGTGSMALERHDSPSALTTNRFKRSGYTFTSWNTAANGSGTSYANGVTYSFSTSITLYAQWKAGKAVAKPAIDATVTVGPFAFKSSTLSASLETQISNLASEIKANRDTNIALVGYGEKLTPADELNESLWAANFTLSPHRTSAVETYLKQRLAVLGLKEHSITAKGNGAVAPTSGGAAIKQTKSDLVIATLT